MGPQTEHVYPIGATPRAASLRQMLTERRRELQGGVQGHLRSGGAARPVGSGRDIDREADLESDIELALTRMKSEMLVRLDEALGRLDASAYGICSACTGAIAERRLRALPFAVHCQDCEDRREQMARRAARADRPQCTLSLFPELLRTH